MTNSKKFNNIFFTDNIYLKEQINIYGNFTSNILLSNLVIGNDIYRLPFLNPIDIKQLKDLTPKILTILEESRSQANDNYLNIFNNFSNYLKHQNLSNRLFFFLQSIYLHQKNLIYNLNNQIAYLSNLENLENHQIKKNTKTLFIKIKANSTIDLEYSLKKLTSIYKNYNLKIRIDFNRQLSSSYQLHFNQLLKLYKNFHACIDFFEEPFAFNIYSQIQGLNQIPIAYDESITDLNKVSDFQKIIIIKPALFGDIRNIINLFQSSDKRIILSSFYEPIELYSGYQFIINHLKSKEVHGLSTYNIFN